MRIRRATAADKFRLVEMATRFLLESQYGELFDNRATPATIGALIENVLILGVILIGETDNPIQRSMQAALDAMATQEERTAAVMRMSTTQKAVLNFGDDAGPNKNQIVGMIALVALPHPLTGTSKIAEEIAWWVEPEWRDGLLGPKMLRAAEEWATSVGANVVKMVAPANTAVGDFLGRVGYKAVETAYIKRV